MKRFFIIIPVFFAFVFSTEAKGFEIQVTYHEGAKEPLIYAHRTHTDIAAGSGSDSDWNTWKNKKMASGLYADINIDKYSGKANVYMKLPYLAVKKCEFIINSAHFQEIGGEEIDQYYGYNGCIAVPSTDPYDNGDFYKPEKSCEYTVIENGLDYNPLTEIISNSAMYSECLSSHTIEECLSITPNRWDTDYKPYYNNMSYSQYTESLYRKRNKKCYVAYEEDGICNSKCGTFEGYADGGSSCSLSNDYLFVYEGGCKAKAAKKGQSPADVCYRGSHPTCPYVYCDIDEGNVWENGKCVPGKKKIKGSCPPPLKKSEDRCCCVE